MKTALRATVVGLLMVGFTLGCLLFHQPSGASDVPDLPLKIKKRADKGIYITWYVAKTPSRFNYLIDQAKACGLNTVVIDAKYALSPELLALLKKKQLTKETIVTADPWLSGLAAKLHEKEMILSVRLVVFKDDHLALARPDLAVKIPGGDYYRDLKGGKWADPYAEEVRLYNELIAERAALSGADEVQFDYIRFPAEAASHNAYYPHQKPGVSRVETICGYLDGVKKRLAKYNVSLAVDIFGVAAWQSRKDIESLGQDLKKMANYLDVLSPMLYPSHFHAGYDGFANPGSYPYHFLSSGVGRSRALLSGEATTLVPWIQGFNLRSPNFGPNYISEQIRAAKEQGVDHFLVWNASNNYETTFAALRRRK
ncbi:MAG: putative glycoside hydrolase [Candidatus Margulisiibacteriota bacterium]